ncbi:MAG TPA: hypothetical protein VFE02_16805 [Candidatus Acidoferrales bacterium]|jgi:hypothetical protein|nr:hypothetical protein [Candidatus Acidoferrales bacterium]
MTEVEEVKEVQEIKEAEEGKQEHILRRARRSGFSVPLLPKLLLFPLPLLLLLSFFYFSPNLPAQTTPSTGASPWSHDLGGVWMPFPDKRENGEPVISGIEEKTRPPLTPWGQARFDAAIPFLGPRIQPGKENNPSLLCEPEAVPKSLILPNPFEIVQIPGRVFMFFEEFHLWRTIWTDGRALPKNPDPTYLGYSVGKWEGDTLVVETIGFNDKPWVDAYGNPRSEQMHLTERYRRVDHDTLELSIVIDDPKAYTKTWISSPRRFKFEPGWEIGEYFCTVDEEQDYAGRIRKPAGGGPSAAPQPDLKK